MSASLTRENGLRLDEVTSLKHAHVDREERTLTVVCGKGSKVRVVPLTAMAEALIASRATSASHGCSGRQRITGLSSRIGGYMRRVARKAARSARV